MDAHALVNNFSGTVLVTRNDSILLKKAYGYADYEWKVKNTIDTKFSLASVSKQFTAAAILQLAERKKLSLDDRLSKYYPDFPKGHLITIKMLLTHNSGVSDDVEEIFFSNRSIKQDSVINYIMQRPFAFEPNAQTAYSNTGYYLLAMIIEKVSGQSYSTYLNEQVFKKANMTNSGVSSNETIIKKLAKAYHHKEGKLIKNPYTNWERNIGMDGVYATIEDLYRWNKNLFDSATVLTEASKRQMFTSYNEHNFGYGVLVNPFYNHGRDLIGHDGGFYGTQTSFNKFREDDVFVGILSNNESPSYLLAYGLSAIAFGIPVELPYEHKEVPIDREIFSEYVGNYEGIKIHQKGDRLLYSEHDIELIPESESKFFRADDNNRTIEFIRNEEGEVYQIIVVKAGVKEIKKKTG